MNSVNVDDMDQIVTVRPRALVIGYKGFQIPEKGFRPEAFLRFKHFGDKVPLSQNYLTSEGVVSHNVSMFYTTEQLSVARYQVSF